jgi:hypothetical protein
MKARVSISAKILLLSSLNVLLLALVFAAFVRIQYRLDLSSLLLSPGRDRILATSRLIALQLPDTDRKDWDRLLASYAPSTHASPSLFNGNGEEMAGPPVTLPEEVATMVRHEPGPHPRPPELGCDLRHNFAVRQGYALFQSTGCRRCWLEYPGLILSRLAPFACYPAPNTLTNIINSGGRLIETMV